MRFPVLSSKAACFTSDCKTIRIFAYSSTREQSNKRSGTRLKTESETGERQFFSLARVRLVRHALPISLLILRKKPTVLQSSFTLDLWQTTSASTTRQWEIQKQRFGRQYTVYFFFPDFLSTQNRVRVIEGEFIWKDLRGNKNYFELAGGSSYRG